MKTLKTSRLFIGSPISFRALCQLEDRPLPYSMLDVVRTDGFRQFNGQISTGDVDATWEFKVWQNGFWSAKSDFHDGGTLAGDFFFLDLLLDHDHSIGARLEGSILDVIESRHLSLNKDGSDRWVRENWHKFEASGPTARLHAAAAIGQLFVVGITALYIAVGVFFQAGGTRKRTRRGTASEAADPGGTRPVVEIDNDPEDDDPEP